MDRGAESIQHFHFLQDIFATGGSNDQELATLSIQQRKCQERRNKRGSNLGMLQLTTNEKQKMDM